MLAFNGSDAVTCRMYRNFKEIWEGFSKNLFPALGYSSSGLLILVVIVAACYVLPYLFLFRSLLLGESGISLFWLPLSQIIIALLCRLIIAKLFRQSLFIAFLHVFSQVLLIGIALNSFLKIKFGRGALWKGRHYNFS